MKTNKKIPKNKKKEIYICLPTHNEEKNLENCLASINLASKFVSNYIIKTFVCLSDCNDKSDEIAIYCKQKYPKINIEILESKKSKLNAQKKMLQQVPINKILFFIDADTEVHKKSIKIILKEFEKHKKLLAIGAFPIGLCLISKRKVMVAR